MDKNIGVILDGRYEVKKRIGVGGMADVYRAYDRTEGRDVAVKILKNEYTKNDEFLQRFKNESKAVSMLSHPNIVKVLDVGFNDDMRFIVMEYIDGITLKDYMESQQKVDWKEASHFVIQILRALGHAHDRGIIHRDIKPQNIMMFEDGTIKVMDFGIAKFTYELGITATAQTIGSVHYISPEQAGGKMTDGSSDIYSVGIILYEMLTGKKPFDTDSPLAVALMQMNDVAERPRSVNPDISVGQEEIILRAIEKNPADRYHTAREMISDIEILRNNPNKVFGYVFSGIPAAADEKTAEETRPQAVKEQKTVSEPEPDPRDYDPDAAPLNYRISNKSREEREADNRHQAGNDDVEYETPGSGIAVKLATIGTVIAMIVVVAVIAGVVNRFTAPKEDTSFVMPSLLQYNYDDMVKKYSGRLVITVEGDAVYSEYVADTILEQSIEAGQTVERGTQVFVTVSNGRNVFVVPDVAGKNLQEAVDVLKDIHVNIKTIFNDTVPYDTVIRISPEAGTELETTESVTIYVSKGSQDDSKIIPNVVGKQKDEALNILKEAGFKDAEFEEKDDKAPEGQVINQNFPGDTLVNPKEKIIIYVSTGKIPTEDVTFRLDFPDGAIGIASFRVYIDDVLTQSVEDINIDGFEYFDFDITGSEKKKVKVEIQNIFNGETAIIGTYNFDFEAKKYDVIQENLKDALEKTGCLRKTETTVAVTSASPSHSPSPSHAPSPSPSHSPSPSPSPSPSVEPSEPEITEGPSEEPEPVIPTEEPEQTEEASD